MNGAIVLLLRALMILALYGFLGWALYLLWRDFKRQSEAVSARQPIPLTLIEQNLENPRQLNFKKADIFLGRDPTNDVCLNDKTVSSQHARLAYHHNQWWVEDLGSMNGTYLNQEIISAPTVITNGDQLRCGLVAFEVLLETNS
jgi:pSer/pThr/pTyr-binding forkhead associated (FHA) protein